MSIYGPDVQSNVLVNLNLFTLPGTEGREGGRKEGREEGRE
jgi:hypothetical protein